MGINGVYDFGRNYFGVDTTGTYLYDAMKFYTRGLGYNPGFIWSARNATQALNSYTHLTSQPYGFYRNYTGTPRYVVMSQYEMPYQVARSLHGYRVETQVDPTVVLETIKNEALLGAIPGMVAGKISNLSGIAIWNNKEQLEKLTPGLYDYLKENNASDLEEAKEVEKQVKILEKRLELAMKNEAGLAPDKVLEQVKAIGAEIDELIKTAGPIKDALVKAQQEFAAEQAEEAAEKARAEAEADADEGEAVEGETTVTTTEGDKELTSNRALAEEYDVKEPVIASEQNVDSIASSVKLNTGNNDDAQDYQKFSNMFTTKEIKPENILEVLEVLGTYDLYDGIYEMDNSRAAMKLVFDTIRNRVNLLKENKYLSAEDAKKVTEQIKTVEDKLGTGEDIPDSSPVFTVSLNGTAKNGQNVNKVLQEIVTFLKDKGTQADFDAKVTAKKNERIAKAKEDFWTAHARTASGKKVKDKTANLPEGVTYLPNSKQFQWKYDAEHIFKAESYKKLGEKILNSKDTKIIAAWNDVLKILDNNLEAEAAS